MVKRLHHRCPLGSKYTSISCITDLIVPKFSPFYFQLCQNFQIKTISSRLSYLKAHGKVENSHRVLRNKIHDYMVKLKYKGVNWVENLPKYMPVLNKLAREELGWEKKSRFEVYYKRKSKVLAKSSHKNDKTICWIPTSSEPTKTWNIDLKG